MSKIKTSTLVPINQGHAHHTVTIWVEVNSIIIIIDSLILSIKGLTRTKGYAQEHLETGGTGGLSMKEYMVIYEWTGRNYSAYVPDLPGCIACADTLEETERLIVEGIKLCIEARKEAGQPVPEPTTKAKAVVVAL